MTELPNENSSQSKMNFDEKDEQELTKKLTENKVTPDMCRLAFYTLIGAAMAYREMYFRDDIQLFKSSPPPSADALRTKGMSKLTAKGARKIHDRNNEAFERNIVRFNQMVYREIEIMNSTLTPSAKNDLDDITGFITACTEELLAAHDKHEVHSVLKMYNANEFDFLFDQYRKDKLTNQKAANETTPTGAQ